MDHLFTILNGGVFAWLVAGVFMKRRHPLHMMWMTFGFALDFALLLYIELARNATGQIFAPMGFWLLVHIIIATLLVGWYPALLFSGGKGSAGKARGFHSKLAASVLVLRFLLWLTAVLAMQGKAA